MAFTTSKLGLQPQFVELLRMLVERILGEVFPEETGAARLQQVGLFTLIFVLQNDKEPVTASRIAALSGQAHSEVSRQVQKLLKIGLVERTAVTSPHGRGRAWHLSVKRGPESKKLLEALFGAEIVKSAGKGPSKTGTKARPRTPPR